MSSGHPARALRIPSLVATTLLLVLASSAPAAARRVPLDRVVARYTAPELGGAHSPRFIFERSLAFESRLEALSEEGARRLGTEPYKPRHVRAALERQLAETLLAAREIEPAPGARVLALEELRAERLLVQRAGGTRVLTDALRAEGIAEAEFREIVRRRARASLYLDRMVLPMLEPSEAELRAVLEATQTPFRGRPYAQVAVELRSWYVTRRLGIALQSFFESVRDLVKITLVG